MAVRSRWRRSGVVLSSILALLSPAPVRAETPVPAPAPSAAARARDEFQQGVEALEHGELARAAEHFEAAQALSPNPVVLYDLGQTYSALGLPVKAEHALRLYLESTPPPSDPARVREVEDLIAFNQHRIGAAVVEEPWPGTTLELDGAPLALPPDGRVRLSVGRHVFVATAAGGGSRIVNVDIRADEVAHVSFDVPHAMIAPPPPSSVAGAQREDPRRPAPAERQPPRDSARARGGGFRVAGLSALGLGAAALVTGAVFGIEALRRDKDSYADGHCDRNTCDSVGLPLRSAAVRDGNWSSALIVAGAASSALGLAFYFYFAPESERKGAKSGAALAPSRRVRLVAATPGFGAAGLTLDMEF